MGLGLAPCFYLLIEMDRLQWTYGSTVEPLDIFFSILLMVSLLELIRRAFGWALPLRSLDSWPTPSSAAIFPVNYSAM